MAYYPAPMTTTPVMIRQRNVSEGHVVVAWILCILCGLSLLPWAIAASRDKRSTVSILLVNLFLGWTVIGWFWALIWACLDDPAEVIVAAPVLQPVTYATPPAAYRAPTYPAYQQSAPRYPVSAPQYPTSASRPHPEPTLVLPPGQPSAPSYDSYGQTLRYENYGH